jgi:hypothetical protein
MAGSKHVNSSRVYKSSRIHREQSTASADSIIISQTTCAYLCCFSADKLCSADRDLEHMVHLAVGSNTTPMNSLLVLHNPRQLHAHSDLDEHIVTRISIDEAIFNCQLWRSRHWHAWLVERRCSPQPPRAVPSSLVKTKPVTPITWIKPTSSAERLNTMEAEAATSEQT